jgi:phosphoserine phosphatase RsbU/P
MKVLIIEDDIYNAELLEEFLTIIFKGEFEDPIETKILSHGKYVVKEAVSFEPDVILLDILMPDKNGLDCIEELQNVELTIDIPIIVISAKIEYSIIQEAITLGAFEYIKKPFDRFELLTKLKMAHRFCLNNKKLKEYQTYANINESLIHAKRIQNSLFPDKEKRKNILPNSDYIYIPKDILSGDFLWLNKIGIGKKIIFVGDCTGHGLPGAMLTVMGSTLLNKNINYRYEYTPAKILDYLGHEINILLNSKDTYTLYDGLDGACLLLDEEHGFLEYAGASTPLIITSKQDKLIINGQEHEPHLIQDSWSLFMVAGDNISVGKESINYTFNNHRLKINKGDRLYLSTDGYSDQIGYIGTKSSKYGRKRYLNTIINFQESSIFHQKTILYEKHKEWRGQMDQMDDILILIIEI